MKKMICFIVGINFLFANCVIGIAGGYKSIFEPVISKYNKIYKTHVKAIYAPMGVLIFHAKRKTLNVVIGDRSILNKFHYKPVYIIGKDNLIILSKKKISLKDLTRILIAVPNKNTTTYGKAAAEAFKNMHLKINSLIVSMMPQGVNYMIMNQVQAAVSSYSMAMMLKKFKYYVIPEKFYAPIYISMSKIKNSPELKRFILFLQTKQIKNYLKKYGL